MGRITTKEHMLEFVSELQKLQRSTIANKNTKWHIEIYTQYYSDTDTTTIGCTLFDMTKQIIKDPIPDSDDLYNFYISRIHQGCTYERNIAELNKVKDLIDEIDNYEY